MTYTRYALTVDKFSVRASEPGAVLEKVGQVLNLFKCEDCDGLVIENPNMLVHDRPLCGACASDELRARNEDY